MASIKEYSSGCHAQVWTLTRKQKVWFPQADLARREPRRRPDTDPFVLFYQFKIAEMLFPDTFISVVGARSGRNMEFLNKPNGISNFLRSMGMDNSSMGYFDWIFSKRSEVGSHAEFSSHHGIDPFSRTKTLQCVCASCYAHGTLHRKWLISDELISTVNLLLSYGIKVPFGDATDFCKVEDKIVFFEIDSMDLKVLAARLLDGGCPGNLSAAQKNRLNRYIGRIQARNKRYVDTDLACKA